MAATATAPAVTPTTPSSSNNNHHVVQLSEDPFKAHILDYDYYSDDEYNSEDDNEMADDPEDWADLEEEYERKEDEDVAVFRAIIDNLPISSLLHLLQGHVRAMQREGNLVTSVEVFEDAKQEEDDETAKEEQKEEKEEKRVEKQFRWATTEDDDMVVKSDIHEVEPMKDYPDIWFSASELHAIRYDLVRQIKFFVRHHQERIEVLDKVIKGDGPEPHIEDCIKELTRHSIGRGLEGHISRLIPKTRKDHVWGIVNAQFDCSCRLLSYDDTCDVLREQSLINGSMMSLYAQRMAKSDEIEAMIAKMSRWEAEDSFP